MSGKISDQNTQGVRRSKSQTESEQNRFSENKTSWLFFPRIFFLWSVYVRSSLPGCKQHTKVLVWIFSVQCGPRMKLQKLGRNFTISVEDSLGVYKISEKFFQNGFSWNSTQESPLNLGQNGTNFRSNGWVFTHEKNQTVSHTNEPSFHPWQWRIKNLLPILWDESGAQTSAKTQ